MRGLHKSTGYWQSQAAKEDWAAIAEFANQNGLGDVADKLTPPDNWGWRRIDKRIAKLREALRAIELEFVLPSRR
jgi:hypothetical protein